MPFGLKSLFGGGDGGDRPARVRQAMAQAEQGAQAFDLGKPAEGAASLRAAVETLTRLGGPDDAETVTALRLVASVLAGYGDHSAGGPLLERAVQGQARLSGPDHPSVADLLDDLGLFHAGTGNFQKSRETLERSLAIRARGGPDDLAGVRTRHLLGCTLLELGEYDGAESCLRAAVDSRLRQLGPEDKSTVNSLDQLATVLHKQKQHLEALDCIERVLAVYEQPGADGFDLAHTLDGAALILKALGDVPGGERLQRRAVDLLRATTGPLAREELAKVLGNLANTLANQGDDEGALPLLEEALGIKRSLLGNEHPSLAYTLHGMALICGRRGDFAAGEPRARQAYELWARALGPDHPQVRAAQDLHANLLADLQRSRAAAAPTAPGGVTRLRFCIVCGTGVQPYPFRDDATYWCGVCEAQQAGPKGERTGQSCPKCGCHVPFYTRFCGLCGTRASWAS